MNMGRKNPTYTGELLDYICKQISEGIPLAEICRQKDIGRTTVYDWMKENPTFAEQFARARDVGFDAIAEECFDIADNSTNDWMERNRNGVETCEFNADHVQRSKLRIETRLKLLAKWNPKKYGDKLEIEHNGGVTVDFRDAE